MTARAAVVGAGPAGLMAAEALGRRGVCVDVYEAMPSPARKLLFAGKSGLNITHAEPFAAFLGRYGAAADWLGPSLQRFSPEALRAWVHDLGIETFVGSSGRVFPIGFKAAPLLRAWLRRLGAAGATLHTRHRWQGWSADGALIFATPQGPVARRADVVVLALGGASWPRLGGDGGWTAILEERGVGLAPLRPANVGFEVNWSDHFADRFAGEPLKNVVLSHGDATARGDVMVTRFGIEGGPVYELSADLRDALGVEGTVSVFVDLLPDRAEPHLLERLRRPRGKRTLANHLRQAVGVSGIKAGLLREVFPPETLQHAEQLAAAIKRLPLTLTAARPLAEAISSAGGVRRDALTDDFMLRAIPGVFCAGEMLDWEVRTGGYLLTACFATGLAAGEGAANWLDSRAEARSGDA